MQESAPSVGTQGTRTTHDQYGTSTPSSRSLANAAERHAPALEPSARIPVLSGPPLAAKVQAGRSSASLSASTLSIAFTPCSASHSRMSSAASSMSPSCSIFGHRPLRPVTTRPYRRTGREARATLVPERAGNQGESRCTEVRATHSVQGRESAGHTADRPTSLLKRVS